MVLFSSLVFFVLGILAICSGVFFISQAVSWMRLDGLFDITAILVFVLSIIVVVMGCACFWVGMVMNGWLF